MCVYIQMINSKTSSRIINSANPLKHTQISPNTLSLTHNNNSISSSNIVLAHTSIPVLQQQLRALKQQQKKYNKLTGKLKQIEQQFQDVTNQQQIQQINVQSQLQQIQKYKTDIAKCMQDTKRLQAQSIQISKQIQQALKQKSSLSGILQNIKQQNSQRRNNIMYKGMIYKQKQKQLQNIQKLRDQTQLDIEDLKLQVQRLVQQQYKFKKQAEIVEWRQQQQQKAARHYHELAASLRVQKADTQAKVSSLSAVLSNEEEKYKNIKQQIGVLSREQTEYLDEIKRRQNISRENRQKIIKNRAKIESMIEEIQSVEQDLKLLSNENSKQTDRLRDLQSKNSDLNTQLDQVCRDARQMWESLSQTLDIAASNQDIWSLDSLMKIRSQALEIWNEVESIMQ